MVKGKLLSTEQDRETLLALLLENIARIAPSSWAIPRSGALLSRSSAADPARSQYSLRSTRHAGCSREVDLRRLRFTRLRHCSLGLGH
jgi:hypothetical protein